MESNSASLSFTLDNPSGVSVRIYYRYRTGTQSFVERNIATSGEVVSVRISGLLVDVTYFVEASLASTYTNSVSNTFETSTIDSPAVLLVGISFDEVTNTSGRVTFTLDNPHNVETILHYRVYANLIQPRRYTNHSTRITSNTVRVTVSGLDGGTVYTVQGALSDSYDGVTASTFFQTTPTPAVPVLTGVRAFNQRFNSTNVTFNLRNPDGEFARVYFRYRTGSNPWVSGNIPTHGVASTWRIRDLQPATTYTLQASLTSDFSEGVVSTTFTTRTSVAATLTRVAASDAQQTSAVLTFTLNNPDPRSVRIYYRLSLIHI